MVIKDCYIEQDCLIYIVVTDIYNVSFSHSVPKTLPHSEVIKELKKKALSIDKKLSINNNTSYI